MSNFTRYLVVFSGMVLVLGNLSCRSLEYLPKFGMIRQLGVEETANRRLLFTQVFAYPEDARHSERIIDSTGKLFCTGQEMAGYRAPLTLKFGKLQQLLVSEQIARQGITQISSWFYRNYQNPPQALLLIVESSPQKLLKKEVGRSRQVPLCTYIDGILTNTYGRLLPALSLLEFDVRKFAPGLDPVAPIIRLGLDGTELAGTALFTGDRLTGRINNSETGLLMLMLGAPEVYNYALQDSASPKPLHPSKKVVAVAFKKVRRQLRVRLQKNRPLFMLEMKLQGNIIEYIWDNLDKPEVEKAVTKAISQKLEQDCVRILRYAQSVESDPLGWGDMLRAKHYQYWKRCNWLSVYAKTPIKVKVDFKMERYGLIR